MDCWKSLPAMSKRMSLRQSTYSLKNGVKIAKIVFKEGGVLSVWKESKGGKNVIMYVVCYLQRKENWICRIEMKKLENLSLDTFYLMLF